ncbi:MAG: hypothetical protein HY363_02265 [Candidatus Aenigmarchaeota archaeon]|nr:hypothetical protein [Candidatus Aenigmarchaeota archaeon]
MHEFQKIHYVLLKQHGPQRWWPLNGKYTGKSRLSDEEKFEICVGAILTQNTSWKNVEKALCNLQKAELLKCEKIANSKREVIAALIRPTGYFNQKAKKLQLFSVHVQKRGLQAMFNQPLQKLREELLSLWGIGPETADSIILYAAQKPIFVIDAYTRRIFSRLGYCREDCVYDDLQRLLMASLPMDVKLFKEYHALIVEHAKVCCTKNNVLSDKCILKVHNLNSHNPNKIKCLPNS